MLAALVLPIAAGRTNAQSTCDLPHLRRTGRVTVPVHRNPGHVLQMEGQHHRAVEADGQVIVVVRRPHGEGKGRIRGRQGPGWRRRGLPGKSGAGLPLAAEAVRDPAEQRQKEAHDRGKNSSHTVWDGS